MKLRALICLFLMIIIVSDVTIVAAHNYTPNFDYGFDNMSEWDIIYARGTVSRTLIEPLTQGTGAFRMSLGYVDWIDIRENTEIHISAGDVITFDINSTSPHFRVFFIMNNQEIGNRFLPVGRHDNISIEAIRTGQGLLVLRTFHGHSVSGCIIIDNLRINNIGAPIPPIPINISHALNFTLAAAITIPVMTVDLVDDIMLTIGKYINCGLSKFVIRSALLKLAAKGIAIVAGITAVSYLLGEFADDIYYAIFATVPAVQPGDTHFHKNDLPQVMGIIHSYFPTQPHITKAIEQAIRLHIDIYGYISIAEVMTIIKHKQEEIVIDVYKETPEILPDNINVHKDQIDDVMKIVDEYFPTEIPIRNIIEEEVRRQIEQDEFNEIPFREVIKIIEREQNIYIPEFPVKTPEQHQEYIHELRNKVNYTDIFVPIPATPYIFPGIPETPIIPRPPKRPDDKIHTFPFYSIFVDPIASVIGIKLAHLFAAMMVVGTIISIASSWGVIGAILGGFIGTFMTSYFGLTSWLIPLYLILVFIIYLNIKIRKGSDTG